MIICSAHLASAIFKDGKIHDKNKRGETLTVVQFVSMAFVEMSEQRGYDRDNLVGVVSMDQAKSTKFPFRMFVFKAEGQDVKVAETESSKPANELSGPEMNGLAAILDGNKHTVH